MSVVKITTPIDEATIRSLHVGDSVSITGRLYTGRDAVHHRIHEGVKPPVDLEGQIIDHCGPVMLQEGDQWICKAAGPTTSSREEPYEHEVIRDYKIRGVIGKGGMGEKTLAACKEYGAVYLHAIGGAAQVCARIDQARRRRRLARPRIARSDLASVGRRLHGHRDDGCARSIAA